MNLTLILTDIQTLLKQVSRDLGVNLSKVGKPIHPCPLINMDQIATDISERVSKHERIKVKVREGLTVPLNRYVEKINEQQRFLCAIGFDLLKEINLNELVPVAELEKWKKHLMQKLNISKYHRMFDDSYAAKILSNEDVQSMIFDYAENGKVPSTEKLLELGMKYAPEIENVCMEEFGIELPEISLKPTPVAPERRKDLNLLKKKTWPGINLGNRKVFGAYANAWLEVRGQTYGQQIVGVGRAGLYIINNDLNAVYAEANLETSISHAPKGHLKFTVLGYDFLNEKIEAEAVEDVDSALKGGDEEKEEIDESYKQTFMVGPIPFSVAVGGKGSQAFYYQHNLVTMRANGDVGTKSFTAGYAMASIGISGLLSGGVEGQITLIQSNAKVTGAATFLLNSQNIPELTLGLEGNEHHSALGGRIFLFAEYPVPRWGIPPWKTKKSTYDIWNSKGFAANMTIIDYKIRVTPDRVKVDGSLVDQADIREAQVRQQKIDEEKRKMQETKEAVAELERLKIELDNFKAEVESKAEEVIQGVRLDMVAKSPMDQGKFTDTLFTLNAKINFVEKLGVDYMQHLKNIIAEEAME